MVSQLWSLNMIFGSASIGLLVALLALYARNLRQMRSAFGLGLVVFAVLLIAQTGWALWSMFEWATAGWPDTFAVSLLYLNIVQTSAFGVLLGISWG
ncbi:MAG: hypothetical protein LN410_02245 [Candidatus Thermoplasmatota archaeon]|nr:hypothetical protein [Candidatus Thermoplasmatota archaeon]